MPLGPYPSCSTHTTHHTKYTPHTPTYTTHTPTHTTQNTHHTHPHTPHKIHTTHAHIHHSPTYTTQNTHLTHPQTPHTPTYTTQNTTHTHAHPENIPGAIHPCPAPLICDAPLTCDARYGELAAHAVTQGGGRTRENASPPHRASRWGEGPGYCSLPSSAVREPLTSAPRRIGLILQTEKMEAGKESDRKAKAARP